MNDQSKMMNQAQIMAAMSQAPPPMMMMSQISQPMMMNPNQPPPMMNRVGGYNKVWSQPPQQQQQQAPMNPNFSGRINNNNNNNKNWKGKKNGNDPRRIDNNSLLAPAMSYKPPTLHELQSQNRAKARKFYPNNNNNNKGRKFNNRFAPYAPRNTTSFIIRAKKSGGIASLVSPSPATPAVLPTPMFSPSREVLGDMAKEEWGVDGYGSMKGLIRLRSPGNDDEEEEGGSGESDVEEHVEVERRLDHDLSRFEMIYPNYSGTEYNNVLENRVDDQDSHIAQLEDENLTLKERLFLMEREMGDLRRRLLLLERRSCIVAAGDVNEEVVENESENESEGPGTSSAKNNNQNNQNREGTEDLKEERETGDAFMGDSDQPRDDDVVAVENGTEVEEEEDNSAENNGDSVKEEEEEEARTKSS